MIVEDFRKWQIYESSLDLMISIYALTDRYQLNPDVKQDKELYQLALKIPRLIASGIGQSNIKIRIKKLNEAKQSHEELLDLLNIYGGYSKIDYKYLDDIEHFRVKGLKLLNGYFGWLKKSVSA
jgi:four helix bundle protein